MLKDLVDYFKLEDINIDNWTFKLYYKVNILLPNVIKYSVPCLSRGNAFVFQSARSMQMMAGINICQIYVKCVKI